MLTGPTSIRHSPRKLFKNGSFGVLMLQLVDDFDKAHVSGAQGLMETDMQSLQVTRSGMGGGLVLVFFARVISLRAIGS